MPHFDVLQQKMPSDFLSEMERNVVKRTLQAITYGSFLDDWEFDTLMGLSREEVKEVADAYPEVDEYDEAAGECDDSWLAINNSFVNLAEFSKGKENEYREYLSLSPQDLLSLHRKWRYGNAEPGGAGNA